MMPFDSAFWTQIWSDLASAAVVWLPRLFGALALILLGWLVARLVRFILRNLLDRLRLDSLAQRTGISKLFADAGIDPSITNLLSRIVYWIILLLDFCTLKTELPSSPK
jgi:hypothetical protein